MSNRTKRHDHRRSLWIISAPVGGYSLAWCYQCGAWRNNGSLAKRGKWHKPTGIGGPNPAMQRPV